MAKHHKYGPSSLGKLELCPCFMQDNSTSNKAADAGTRLHLAAETGDLSHCRDEEEAEAVTRALDFKDQFLGDLKGEVTEYNELRLQIGEFAEGTGDVVAVSGNKGFLLDWKFGRWPVEDADKNIQMQSYVLGVFTKFPEVDEVQVAIVGPLMDFLSTATYQRSDIGKIELRIANIIERCEASDKVEAASDDACRFCGRKAECPRIAETALAVADNIGLPLPIVFEPGQILRPEDRARAQVLSYIVEDWAAQVRKYNAKAVLEDGIEVPGFELRSRKGTSTVADVYAVVQQVIAEHNVSIENALSACSLSIPKLVEQIYAQAQVEGKKVTKKSVRENLFAEIVEHITESDSVTFLQRKRGKTNEEIIKECT